jgi:hypothetical protein
LSSFSRSSWSSWEWENEEGEGSRIEAEIKTWRIVRYTIIIPHAPISGKCGYPILVLVIQH